MTITIRRTAENTYFRIVNPEAPERNWGIVSPRDGQLAVRPTLRQHLNNAGSHTEKVWVEGPGRHGGVDDYEYTHGFASPDETLGYLSRSLGKLGFLIQDERDA